MYTLLLKTLLLFIFASSKELLIDIWLGSDPPPRLHVFFVNRHRAMKTNKSYQVTWRGRNLWVNYKHWPAISHCVMMPDLKCLNCGKEIAISLERAQRFAAGWFSRHDSLRPCGRCGLTHPSCSSKVLLLWTSASAPFLCSDNTSVSDPRCW